MDHSRFLKWVFVGVGLYVLFLTAAFDSPKAMEPELNERRATLLDEVPDTVYFGGIDALLAGAISEAPSAESPEPSAREMIGEISLRF